MRSWPPWSRIYRPRIVWLVVLLLVLLAPADRGAPAKCHLAYTIVRAVLASFDAVIGLAGVTAATAGLACGSHGLYPGGALAIVFAVDNTLWRRAVRCRHELDVERGIARSR